MCFQIVRRNCRLDSYFSGPKKFGSLKSLRHHSGYNIERAAVSTVPFQIPQTRTEH